MSTVRRFGKNAILLYSARLISTLGKFFLFIYVARVLGEATLGKFTFATVFTSFFGIIISLGMDDLLVREVARDKTTSGKYLGNIALIRLLLSLVVFACIIITINIMDYPADTRLAVYIFGGYIVFTAFSFLFRANFRAYEQMEWDALLEVLEALITTGGGIMVILAGGGLIGLSLTFLGAAVINTIVGIGLNRWKFARPKIEIDVPFWQRTIVSAAPFSVFALFLLYSRVDTVMLSVMKGDEIVGNYNAAYQVVLAFNPLVMNFMLALVPLLSRYFISARTMLGLAYEKSFKYLVIIGFPVSVGGMVLADKLIPLLYGPGYDEAVIALRILSWNCLLLTMSRPMLYVLGAINRQGTCALITIAGLAVSLALNYLTIPRWSYIGSGAATLISGALVTLAAWYATGKFGFPLRLGATVFKPMLASLIMGVVIYLADSQWRTGLPALILLGTGVYVLLLYTLKSFSRDDWSLLGQAVGIGGRTAAPLPESSPAKAENK